MKTTEIAIVDLLDEFTFEQSYVQIPSTLAALRAREGVILVQDESCEFVVTLERGAALKLWNPEIHWADQRVEPFEGTLAEAVARAMEWLARYLRVSVATIDPVIGVEAFPARLLALRKRSPKAPPPSPYDQG